jgi:5-methylthioadenosine/S-adenosylhomocysteine deaminase
MEMRLAALIHKPRLGSTAMPATKVLEMATKGGAEAMGMKDEIGSIEPGKRADIIILDIDHAHAAPTENVNLISRIVYEAKAADVETTIVDGRILMHERKLTSIDEEEVIREANKALERVLRRAGVSPSSKK